MPKPKLDGKLYVAYGSNLCKASMHRRCPSARPLGRFMLTDARLIFRGVADVEYAPGEKVPCGLWLITPRDEASLDAYEGVNTGFYFKNEHIVLKYKGERRRALIYLMTSEGIYPPSASYVDTIRRGYRDFGLDESYLDAAVEHSFHSKSPDEQTRSRRARQRAADQKLVPMPESVALARQEAAREAELERYWNTKYDSDPQETVQ